MQYRELGNTGIQVSALCLGTMTFGEQNTEKEAHEQLDYAFSEGINFIDTAEMYPVPPRKETYSLTEKYIGTWSKLRSDRDKIIVATKVLGPSRNSYVRDGNPRLDRHNILQAVDASLQRLKIDYIDLYQLHWPDRNTNFFGKLGYEHRENEDSTPIEDTLLVLDEIKKSGKVRHFGLSNETPWGTMRYFALSDAKSYPRMVSIQNPYNLLNRTFEVGLAEIAHREKIGLLAYSPMAFGALSGKYRDGEKPEGARLTLWERFGRYKNEKALQAIDRYAELAEENDLSPAQMALAFVTSRSFVTSNIIGATSMEQLRENIGSVYIKLDAEILKQIEEIQTDIPNPSP
ncbi:MAG: NADP(H)-dependent aldo-keto reductase [Spirochaetota bacterium]